MNAKLFARKDADFAECIECMKHMIKKLDKKVNDLDKYNVTGMSCSACSASVEKAVKKVKGIDSCTVSLLTNSMTVEGKADPKAVIEAVEKAGYGASLMTGEDRKDAGKKQAMDADELDNHAALHKMKVRLIASIVMLIPLMYISMGHMMWGWPLPAIISDNHVAMGLIQMLFAIAIMVVNQKFFINGFKGVVHGAPGMDTLVALGSGASFIYSTYVLFAMTDAVMRQDNDRVMTLMHDFYFESAAMILALITVGKTLEEYSKGRTTDALKGLMKLAPKTAIVLRGEEEQEVAAEDVTVGDVFIVRPGSSVPVDGVVIEGNSAVDESALSGESLPVDKAEGDKVSAATINKSGYLKCRATRVGTDTTLSQIIEMVSDAAATKAPIAKIADKVSGIFVPAVLICSLITIIVWIIAGESTGFVLARGISVLVISCPCALGLATPVAVMVGNGVGAKQGILFKNAAALEMTGKTDVVILDKTGTITNGTPEVVDVVSENGYSETDLLTFAASLEQYSEHPIGKAIMEYVGQKEIKPQKIEDFQVLPGNGLRCRLSSKAVSQNESVFYAGQNHSQISDHILLGGNEKFISRYVTLSETDKTLAEELASQGKTPIYLAIDENKLIGILAVADTIKDDGILAIKELKEMNYSVVMLTGDNAKTAEAIGKQAGVDQVIADVLPDGKEAVVRELMKEHRVIMVGDGINDAPALTRADIGMAIGAGTDVAIDAADVVLMREGLRTVPAAIRLSMATIRNIKENLFWAFIYNIIGIPLAAGVWYPMFGWKLNPMFGAFAMSLSSFCVVMNALRLNFVKIYVNNSKYRIHQKMGSKNVEGNNKIEKETGTMNKTVYIEGMMCGHCEARVKKAFEALPQVTEAEVSHEKKQAVLTLSGELSDKEIKNTVKEAGYKVTSIK